MGRLRRLARSVRGRSAILATLVVAFTLTIGSFVLLEAYENQLVDNLDTTLEQQVVDRVRLIDTGGPKTLLTTVLQDEAFVWIGTPAGEATATGGAIVPIDHPIPDPVGQTATLDLLVEETKPDETEQERMELRIASGETTTGLVVLAGAELETVDNAVADLARLFAIFVPIMTLIVGALAWLISDRALRPVAAIQAQATEISGATLDERVPVPDTADEIESLATTVNDMLDRIEAHDVAIRRFSADASHELKSPVANIRALVESRADAGDWVTLRAALTAETDRLGDLVDNLLFLASHRDGDRVAETTAVALDELLFAEAELVAATSHVRVDLAEVQPATVEGSVGDLGRLVRNLVDNASRHADRRIALALRQANGTIDLSVEDDGAGIPLADRDRIFDRFTRLDEARAREDGGTGLGLSIVRQIAESHGGSVTVDEAELGGARFSVTLPARRS